METMTGTVTLLDHINQRFADLEKFQSAALAAQEKAVNAALAAAEKAVDKAEDAQALRNEAQNEFHKSLGDLSGLMWTIKEGTAAVDSQRREFTALMGGLADRIGTIERTAATLQGRAIAFAGFGALIGGAAVATIMEMF